MVLNDELTNEQIISLWYHYEEIAMHFNGLIIQYRLQLFAGLGALTGIFSYLVGNNIIDEKRRAFIRAIIASALYVIFLAAVYLDLFYYKELLGGAVDSIIRLEDKYKWIDMSSSIKARFEDDWFSPIWITYGLILIPFGLFLIWSWYDYSKKVSGS